MTNKRQVYNAIYLGVLCSISYLAVYFARNILGTVTPQMIESGQTEGYIGSVSSVYFIAYAFGQLINGAIGDKVKARYMISLGLLMAGITNFLFGKLVLTSPDIALVVYAMTGFSLSMIYGPMVKVVAENTKPEHATRCSLGFTFASFFGSPLAGVAATVWVWQDVFFAGSISLVAMAIIVFVIYLVMEKRGIVKYNQYERQKGVKGSVKILIKNRIIKFAFISMITGIVRTTVVFWMPTYISQYLGFSAKSSSLIFTVATLVISLTAFVTVFIYERLHRNMDLTILLMFISAFMFFLLIYFIKVPVLNIAFLVIAIMSSNGAATMLFSRYCPSLKDTGMVSSATGFIDFVSYISAAIASTVFANAVSVIGWGNLILIWCGLMVMGAVVSLPFEKLKR